MNQGTVASKTMWTVQGLTKGVVALLLGLLIWTGQQLIDRIERLETNQITIMVKMGIEPKAQKIRGTATLISPVHAESCESIHSEGPKTAPNSP